MYIVKCNMNIKEDDMDIGLGEEPGNSEDKAEEEYYFEVIIKLIDLILQF